MSFCNKPKVVPVTIAGDVHHVRVLSLPDFRLYQEAVKTLPEGPTNSDLWVVTTVTWMACDEAGKSLYGPADAEDIMGAGVAALLLAEAGIRANGLDIEASKKN